MAHEVMVMAERYVEATLSLADLYEQMGWLNTAIQLLDATQDTLRDAHGPGRLTRRLDDRRHAIVAKQNAGRG